MPDNFAIDKKNILHRKDKSRKGGVDSGIKDIVDIINKHPDYYTTSSCAGRIMLIELRGRDKKGAFWLYSTHGKADYEDIKKALGTPHRFSVWLRQESMILHIACRSFEHAERLLSIAQKSGLKRAGIISTGRRFIVEIFNTERINALVAKNRKVLVSDEHIRALVGEANKKMAQNRIKIRKLQAELKNNLEFC